MLRYTKPVTRIAIGVTHDEVSTAEEEPPSDIICGPPKRPMAVLDVDDLIRSTGLYDLDVEGNWSQW